MKNYRFSKAKKSIVEADSYKKSIDEFALFFLNTSKTAEKKDIQLCTSRWKGFFVFCLFLSFFFSFFGVEVGGGFVVP